MSSSSKSSALLQIPIGIRWKIAKNLLLAESQKQYWHIESDVFTLENIPVIHYYLVIGDGKRLDNPDQMSLGFTIVIDELAEVKANYKISIPSAGCSFRREITYNESLVTGKVICSYDELFNPTNNYFIDGFMVVKMEGVLTLEVDKSDSIMPDDIQLYNCGPQIWERDDKDFTFVVGSQEIKVHKLVISAASPVFDRMIQSGLQESKENKVKIVDFNFETVLTAIKYCYGINDKSLWNPRIATKVLQFSDKYDIKSLKAAMETFLSSEMSPMYICRIANSAIISNSPELREKCFDFMVDCAKAEIYVKDLNILDKDFGMEVLQASLSRCSV